ncbi:conserved hypothetical protein [Talaromyces stipitatus ATCC 10500]|uniref:Uncharacterized protein n=1 Tax=Talaromyces stipitatus (strain ATCC 10500 / CBS 375.48 / QM 6759 / NRRL 1006) TaxID=441959 RepID=B8LX63_TALSN|nr:uncharacterized protein TSTA_062010 [Talaromyces stipitatus ATCC 10500]EED22713.1 conserved hypothetical protein [Talaromyces stipitatus ATCC 10500]
MSMRERKRQNIHSAFRSASRRTMLAAGTQLRLLENFIKTVKQPPYMKLERQTLGVIRYEKESGKVILVNICAQLWPEYLQLRKTSKHKKTNLAGCHGEGLKIATMVMSWNGYAVKIYSNSYTWSFCFQGLTDSQMHCLITPATVLPLAQVNVAQDTNCFVPCICRDVSIIIERGHDGSRVSLEEFRRWLTVSLDIRGFSYPASIVETDHGNLILDPDYQGKVYLKGLYLPSPSSDARSYKLGYNFADGKVNCDRHRELIWKFLLKESNGRQFFYCDRFGPHSFDTIKEGLKKEPISLPDILWNMLRANSLLRTANEEQFYSFKKAKICKVPETLFAKNVERGLKASMALWKVIEKIEFVESRNVNVEMVFDPGENSLKVHNQWLDYGAMHTKYRCRSIVPKDSFVCDHIVEELVRGVMGVIFKKFIARD